MICSNCATGQYSINAGVENCQQCAANKWTCPTSYNGTLADSTECLGKTSCVRCPIGRSGNDGKECTPCSPGYFNDVLGGSCKKCATGQYQPSNGQVSCIECEAGKFNDEEAIVTSCKDCNAGSYANRTGSVACLSCSSGQFQGAKGKTACIACDSVSYAAPGSIACTLCPIPLVVDPRLGPARDESFCVCEADFFLYPSVVLTIALDEISTAGVKFDSANQRLAVRGLR